MRNDRLAFLKIASHDAFVSIRRSVLFLCAICLVVGNVTAQEFRPIHPGVEHALVEHKIAAGPVKINLLRLDLTKVRLDVKLGMDAVLGTETTSSIAKRHRAVAAINSGFFRFDTSIFAGDPAGALKIDGVVLSEPDRGRAVIFIDNRRDRTVVEFGRFGARDWVEVGGLELVIDGMNRERRENELLIFTPEFHRTTLTSPEGVEVIVRGDRVVSILNGIGSLAIPSDGYILSATGTKRHEIMRSLRIGDRLRRFTAVVPVGGETTPPAQYNFEDHTNGVSILLKNGAINLTWEAERAIRSFAEDRHPRTAVAKLKDGRLLMITADGRQPGVSVGMTLRELAEYLLSIGSVDAINLDGGGSTTMVLGGRVINTPSDTNRERKVSVAIVVTLR